MSGGFEGNFNSVLWPILQREHVPLAQPPSTCCMCADDIDLEDCER